MHFIEHAADSESELQTVLLKHPELVPTEDLGLDDDLLVVGRETTLASGNVDLLCLSRSGEIVIIEFKTGPQNPDFRHALAQVIDYGSDLWRLDGWREFDEGVVHRYLASQHVLHESKSANDLREAAVLKWSIGDDDWGALVQRLDQVLNTGDFHFVVAAQRFTEQMKDSTRYLNEVTRHGSYFLVELIRLDGDERKAFAAQVVQQPISKSTGGSGAGSKASESEFLAAISDDAYREAISELLSTASALGLAVVWGTKGASIRLPSPDRNEPISIGWVLPEGAQWYSAKHVTLGVDPATLKFHPTVTPAISTYCDKVKAVPSGIPTPGTLNAATFTTGTLPKVKSQLFDLLGELKTKADAAPIANAGATG